MAHISPHRRRGMSTPARIALRSAENAPPYHHNIGDRFRICLEAEKEIPMPTDMRKTGIDFIGDMPWGSHFTSSTKRRKICSSS
jgi:hypothetical protein